MVSKKIATGSPLHLIKLKSWMMKHTYTWGLGWYVQLKFKIQKCLEKYNS